MPIVRYNTFKAPEQIYVKDKERISYEYDAFESRATMYYGGTDPEKQKRRYVKHYSHDGSVEIVCNKTDNSTKFVFYLGGDAYSAPAILISDGETQRLYYLHRDYLGSIVMLTDEGGNIAERRHFDPWGQPIKVEDGSGKVLQGLTLLDRGFTGHEHLQTVGLVHMNGRLYDPALHRFLQPDNFVQDPFNTQNFNRYGYCLNNPLVYVDENGEIIELIFGLGNLIARAKRGSINNFWDGVGAFFQGFLAGAVAGPGAMASISSLNLSGAVQGLLTGIFSDDWKVFRNSFKIALGNFYIDENRTFMGGLWQGISRHTWELPQTSIGTNYSQFMNMSDEVDRVEYLGGATFSINEESEGSDYGITIGSFIKMNIKDKIEGDFTEYVLTHPLFMHEYGHYIDSQRMGLTYLINVGLPSLISAGTSEEIDGEPRWVNTHSFRWYEMNANKNAERYFNKHYGNRIIWNERDYPRHKRLKR